MGASLTPSACATSMISGFGGPPAPRVILTPLVVSTCAAEAAGVGGGLAHACRRVWGVELSRRGQDFNFRHRKRLAFNREISSRKHNEADGYRKDRDADRRSFCRALVPHGQRRCGARNKTERFVQFVPHFSRRPSLRTSQSRESTLSQPILDRPPKAGLLFIPERARVFLLIFSPDTSRPRSHHRSTSATQR